MKQGTRVIDGIEFVEKNYEIDRNTEQRLASGHQLRDGMMVLVDSPEHRFDLNEISNNSSEFTYAMWANRWAKIEDVEITDDRVFFTASYSNGNIARRYYDLRVAWLVKKEGVAETQSMDSAVYRRPQMRGTRVIDDIEFVERDYEMNPYTEQRLSSGWLLRNGQRILIDSPFHRADLNRILDDPSEFHVAMWMNRWATISEVRFVGDKVFFTTTYSDGSGTKNNHNVQTPWLVKKDKITSMLTPKPSEDGYVGKYYRMDPDADDLIPVGEELTIGMVVLMECSSRRINVERPLEELYPDELQLLDKYHRWGRIMTKPFVIDDKEICFVVEYPDRTKSQMRVHKYEAWYVKKYSLPLPKPPEMGDPPSDPLEGVPDQVRQTEAKCRNSKDTTTP